MRRRGAISLLVAAAWLASCSDGHSRAVVLDGRRFLSRSIVADGADHPLVAGTEVVLRFEGGTVTASAGCNTWSAHYVLQRGVLEVRDAATTDIGCDRSLMEQDTWVFGFLAGAPRLAVAGDRLTLSQGATVMTLLDEEVANPDRELAGVRWLLVTIISGSGDGAVASSVGVDAWIELDPSGRMTAILGCNDAGAGWTASDDVLTVVELTRTLKACPGEGDRVEAAMMATLQGAPTYRIDADRLALRSPGRGLDFVAAK